MDNSGSLDSIIYEFIDRRNFSDLEVQWSPELYWQTSKIRQDHCTRNIFDIFRTAVLILRTACHLSLYRYHAKTDPIKS